MLPLTNHLGGPQLQDVAIRWVIVPRLGVLVEVVLGFGAVG